MKYLLIIALIVSIGYTRKKTVCTEVTAFSAKVAGTKKLEVPISFKECTIDKSTKHLYKLIVEYWFVHKITGQRYESIDFNPDINKHTVRKIKWKTK